MHTVVTPLRLKPTATIWEYLALPESELERADVVALDLAVARGVERFKDLDAQRYFDYVDGWTHEFARRLPASEDFFWKVERQRTEDIRFYRMGILQYFIAQVMGIRYIEEQRGAKAVFYTNPGDLFLNGLIDTKRGTCGNMSTLHVAMARRMGWPVSLACVDNHKVSRFDDGEAVYNIECAVNEHDGFSFGSDEEYLKKFSLPRKAIECGSDLRKLTAREMLAIFVGHRARHFRDVAKYDLCDADCALARALFPDNRRLYTLGMFPYFKRGEKMFNPDEVGHPRSLGGDIEGCVATMRETVKGGTEMHTPVQQRNTIPSNIQFVVRPVSRAVRKRSEGSVVSLPVAGTF
jgi:hypothetical protein